MSKINAAPSPAVVRALFGGSMVRQWTLVLALSIVLVIALELVRLPAALLLGPMLAAIIVAAANGTVRVPLPAFSLAQGVVGCMIAHSIPASVLGEVLHDWPIFVAGVFSVVAAAALLGWLLTRWRVLPGTTAVWGSSPGAAAAMMLMAEAYGADVRLVAFMQYIRVVCVALVVSLVSRIWMSGGAAEAPAMDWFPQVAWLPLAETLALAVIGALLGLRFRIPAGALVLPMGAGIALQASGLLALELPPWLLAAAYAVVGWSVGMRFTRAILLHAWRALPAVLGSTLTLIAICGGFAVVLVMVADVDPLTAYLATSPGGADSVAIIAASSNVDVPFVMAMQMARFLFVLLTGPSLARFIAHRTGVSEQRREPLAES